MSYLGQREKHPSAKIGYPIDVIGLVSGVTISSAVTTASPSGPTIHSTTVDGTRVTPLVSGGTNGTQYRMTTVYTLSNGEQPVSEFDLLVRAQP
jgi:hypothetical protein